eukprot:4544971-Amphidinium_carterae.1
MLVPGSTRFNQKLRTELSRMEAQFALAQQNKKLLYQQACMAFSALKMIRNEAYLFWDKMLVDAKTLCQYHVDKLKKINTHCQQKVHKKCLKLHAIAISNFARNLSRNYWITRMK